VENLMMIRAKGNDKNRGDSLSGGQGYHHSMIPGAVNGY
jgi:hypothetical protein